MINTKETNIWDADKYKKHASFVSELALPVVELLDPKENEKILDLGCGEGTLGVEISKSGAKVVAIDLSEDMVEKSIANGLNAKVMSVTDMPFVNAFDAVFSNATLHWVKESHLAVENIAKSLKAGGRFVAEFGGYGNVNHIVEAMKEVFYKHPEFGKFDTPWYFPNSNEYKILLAEHGFDVEYIELITRPTPIDDISNWLAIFTNGMTEHLNHQQTEQLRIEVREILKATSYTEESGWVADYVRLRIKAIKRK